MQKFCLQCCKAFWHCTLKIAQTFQSIVNYFQGKYQVAVIRQQNKCLPHCDKKGLYIYMYMPCSCLYSWLTTPLKDKRSILLPVLNSNLHVAVISVHAAEQVNLTLLLIQGWLWISNGHKMQKQHKFLMYKVKYLNTADLLEYSSKGVCFVVVCFCLVIYVFQFKSVRRLSYHISVLELDWWQCCHQSTSKLGIHVVATP